MLDVVEALDLIDHLVEIEGRGKVCWAGYLNPWSGDPECIVGRALFTAGVTREQLVTLRGLSVRSLYAKGRLPIEMTFGASEVFMSAQIGQDGGGAGGNWGAAQDKAHETAAKFLDLVPTRIIEAELSKVVTGEKVLVSA